LAGFKGWDGFVGGFLAKVLSFNQKAAKVYYINSLYLPLCPLVRLYVMGKVDEKNQLIG
jgi:hypothetical protein